MSSVKLRASTILGAFEQAQSELVGKAVVLTDGKAGTVEKIWLDELHGLRISVAGHVGKWPVSTVKLVQGEPWRRADLATPAIRLSAGRSQRSMTQRVTA